MHSAIFIYLFITKSHTQYTEQHENTHKK